MPFDFQLIHPFVESDVVDEGRASWGWSVRIERIARVPRSRASFASPRPRAHTKTIEEPIGVALAFVRVTGLGVGREGESNARLGSGASLGGALVANASLATLGLGAL